MEALLIRGFVAAAMLALVAGAAAQGSDRHELHVGVAAGYVGASSDLAAWPDGGYSKLRYDEDGLTATRIFAEYHGRITPTLNARVIADYVDDGSSGIDLTEAFIDWRPIPRTANQHQVRFGAFYPPLSLENGDRGWESPFTYSFSAVNTWLGEEIRPIGAEWSMRRRLQRFGNAQEVRAFASGFYGNDPAATLLFWRGWSLHDRQTRLHDRFDIPPIPLFGAGGTIVALVPQTLKPFTETDHRPGAYAGIEWRYARRALVQLASYDNRADPWSFTRQWGWRTSFDQLALQIDLPGKVGLISQWLWGTTDWVSGALPDGTTTPTAHVVRDEFDAYFVLLTRKIGARHRVALRYDDFYVVRPTDTPQVDSDAGYAWTLSYRFEPSERFSGGIEWLSIESERGLWPIYGAAREATEDQVRLQFSMRVGTPSRR